VSHVLTVTEVAVGERIGTFRNCMKFETATTFMNKGEPLFCRTICNLNTSVRKETQFWTNEICISTLCAADRSRCQRYG